MTIQSVFKALNHNAVGFSNPLVPGAGFQNPKRFQQRVIETLSNIFQTSGPLRCFTFFQLSGSGATPWRRPEKVAFFPWCSVCEVLARVFFAGKGESAQALVPLRDTESARAEDRKPCRARHRFSRPPPFRVLSFAFSGSIPLPLACPCPCLDLSQRLNWL